MKKMVWGVLIVTTIFNMQIANGKNSDFNYFENLTEKQVITGFEVQAVYENNRGIAMGARFGETTLFFRPVRDDNSRLRSSKKTAQHFSP